jgi:hypothetical protein
MSGAAWMRGVRAGDVRRWTGAWMSEMRGAGGGRGTVGRSGRCGSVHVEGGSHRVEVRAEGAAWAPRRKSDGERWAAAAACSR